MQKGRANKVNKDPVRIRGDSQIKKKRQFFFCEICNLELYDEYPLDRKLIISPEEINTLNTNFTFNNMNRSIECKKCVKYYHLSCLSEKDVKSIQTCEGKNKKNSKTNNLNLCICPKINKRKCYICSNEGNLNAIININQLHKKTVNRYAHLICCLYSTGLAVVNIKQHLFRKIANHSPTKSKIRCSICLKLIKDGGIDCRECQNKKEVFHVNCFYKLRKSKITKDSDNIFQQLIDTGYTLECFTQSGIIKKMKNDGPVAIRTSQNGKSSKSQKRDLVLKIESGYKDEKIETLEDLDFSFLSQINKSKLQVDFPLLSDNIDNILSNLSCILNKSHSIRQLNKIHYYCEDHKKNEDNSCICQKVDSLDELIEFVRCDECNYWYHKKCVGEEILYEYADYICQKCLCLSSLIDNPDSFSRKLEEGVDNLILPSSKQNSNTIISLRWIDTQAVRVNSIMIFLKGLSNLTTHIEFDILQNINSLVRCSLGSMICFNSELQIKSDLKDLFKNKLTAILWQEFEIKYTQSSVKKIRSICKKFIKERGQFKERLINCLNCKSEKIFCNYSKILNQIDLFNDIQSSCKRPINYFKMIEFFHRYFGIEIDKKETPHYKIYQIILKEYYKIQKSIQDKLAIFKQKLSKMEFPKDYVDLDINSLSLFNGFMKVDSSIQYQMKLLIKTLIEKKKLNLESYITLDNIQKSKELLIDQFLFKNIQNCLLYQFFHGFDKVNELRHLIGFFSPFMLWQQLYNKFMIKTKYLKNFLPENRTNRIMYYELQEEKVVFLKDMNELQPNQFFSISNPEQFSQLFPNLKDYINLNKKINKYFDSESLDIFIDENNKQQIYDKIRNSIPLDYSNGDYLTLKQMIQVLDIKDFLRQKIQIDINYFVDLSVKKEEEDIFSFLTRGESHRLIKLFSIYDLFKTQIIKPKRPFLFIKRIDYKQLKGSIKKYYDLRIKSMDNLTQDSKINNSIKSFYDQIQFIEIMKDKFLSKQMSNCKKIIKIAADFNSNMIKSLSSSEFEDLISKVSQLNAKNQKKYWNDIVYKLFVSIKRLSIQKQINSIFNEERISIPGLLSIIEEGNENSINIMHEDERVNKVFQRIDDYHNTWNTVQKYNEFLFKSKYEETKFEDCYDWPENEEKWSYFNLKPHIDKLNIIVKFLDVILNIRQQINRSKHRKQLIFKHNQSLFENIKTLLKMKDVKYLPIQFDLTKSLSMEYQRFENGVKLLSLIMKKYRICRSIINNTDNMTINNILFFIFEISFKSSFMVVKNPIMIVEGSSGFPDLKKSLLYGQRILIDTHKKIDSIVFELNIEKLFIQKTNEELIKMMTFYFRCLNINLLEYIDEEMLEKLKFMSILLMNVVIQNSCFKLESKAKLKPKQKKKYIKNKLKIQEFIYLNNKYDDILFFIEKQTRLIKQFEPYLIETMKIKMREKHSNSEIIKILNMKKNLLFRPIFQDHSKENFRKKVDKRVKKKKQKFLETPFDHKVL